jgi:hypothetical protein
MRQMTSRRTTVILGAAATLFALAVFGEADPGGWKVIDEAFDHWAVLGPLSFAVLGLGCCTLQPSAPPARAGRAVLVVGTTVICAGWILLNWVSSGLVDQDFAVTRTIPAPQGHHYTLVISHGADVIDPLWALSVRHGSGLTAREWPFACINGDDPDLGMRSASWSGPAEITVELENRDRRIIQVDADTGRPTGTATNWAGCTD